jgi:hypothetical protein
MRVTTAVEKSHQNNSATRALSEQAVTHTVEMILSNYDELQGGFSQAPKFPHESYLLLLIQQAHRQPDNSELKEAITHTLDSMLQGGIYDQVGGGFHRYAIDNEWLVPHFEKMLYNQALLARVYMEGWQLTGKIRFKRTAEQILTYVLRDMRADRGGFYSATDADSEGEEGAFFVWTPQELKSILGESLSQLAISLYGVSEAGNFEGHSILYLPESLSEFSSHQQMPLSELVDKVEHIREQLYLQRKKRLHPLRDEKIITAWNGMMIHTLALAADRLNNPEYLKAAISAAEFIWQHNRRQDDGSLWRTHLNGNSSIAASQEDYAYLAESFVALFDVTAESKWLDRAIELTGIMLSRFSDSKKGGFYMSEQGSSVVGLSRIKDFDDGATPSGNSVALRLLAQLSTRTGDEQYKDSATAFIANYASMIEQQVTAYTYLLKAVDELQNGEISNHQYGGKGKVSAHMHVDNGRLSLQILITEGWHINSTKPLQDNLIATSLSDGSSATIKKIVYPDAQLKKLGFIKETLSLYEGPIVINAEIEQKDDRAIPFVLTIQTCSDQVCLAPEKLRFIVN